MAAILGRERMYAPLVRPEALFKRTLQAKTASRMSSSSTVSLDPGIPQSAILRRYMDLPKLLDLLHFRALYFRRADGFTDRLEGALFPSLRAAIDEAHMRGDSPHNADYFYRCARAGTYVSCWTRGAKDSMAHWQLYGGAKNGLALTTTVGQLIDTALSWERNAIVHQVKYVDHVKMKTFVIGSYTDVLQFKHEAYKHERELRILIPQRGSAWEANPIHLRLPVPNLDVLVRSVVVAPESGRDFFEVVKGLCVQYGLKAPVRRSKLALVPI